MKQFEVLCVTMHQKDFTLLNKMHLNSDVLICNQGDQWGSSENVYRGYRARMITTDTRGVGINRNLCLLNADAEICLMADDDLVYRENYREKILEEFKNHPEADVIIFNIGTSTPEFGRIPTVTSKFTRFHFWSKNPYGAPRVAFRLDKLKQKNLYFSTCFGGGCIFKTGEDTIWIEQMRKSGLRIYLSPEFIGDVSYEVSTSLIEDVPEKLYTKGAMLEATRGIMTLPKMLLYAFLRKNGTLKGTQAFHMMNEGRKGFRILQSYDAYEER